jgi:hypothetical protein
MVVPLSYISFSAFPQDAMYAVLGLLYLSTFHDNMSVWIMFLAVAKGLIYGS